MPVVVRLDMWQLCRLPGPVCEPSVIEAGSMLGGTMTAGGVNMPNHFSSKHGPVVRGIAWELYAKSKEVEGLPVPDYRRRRPVETPGHYSYINVPMYAAIAEVEAL